MKTQDRVNVAVVGLGFMGVTHLRAYLNNPMARVVAVCDASRVPVNGVLKGVVGNVMHSDDLYLGPDVRVFRTLNELLAESEAQLVDICTPTALHPEQVIASLRAGKHVLCEKPLARHASAACEMLEVANESPGFLMPAMCMRFWPGWSWLKQVVTERTYGNVLAAQFRRVSEKPTWSTAYAGDEGGGALFDLHIHDTDFVNHLFGRPTSVFSSGVISAEDVVSHVVTQYNYPIGPIVSAEGGWLLPQGFNMAYTLLCDQATLDFDFARGADAMQITESGQSLRVLHHDEPDGYGVEIGYFLDCVARGKAPSLVTAQDSVTALKICEAEEQSIRSVRLISL